MTMDEAIIRLLWQRLVLAGGWHPEVLLDSLAADIPPETLTRLRRIVDERIGGVA